MKLFNKPKWLKREVDEPVYWLHLGLIAVVILWALPYFPSWQDGIVLSLKNVLLFIPVLGFADIVAHTILQLD